MKKTSIILLVLFFGFVLKGFSQNIAPTDFYAGKWEILVVGSPRGDVKFTTNLVRKDGKLTGELVNGEDKRPITKIEETLTKMVIYFESSQAGEITMELSKVDENNLKGNVMGSYDATATRVKE